jgi:hypothetical protein
MATFNTSTGCVSGTPSPSPLCPPITTDAQLTAYLNALDSIIKSPAPSIKTKNFLVVKDTSGGGVITTVAEGSDSLPNVAVWQLDGITAAVIYTDASGTSSFSYKNDPTGRIKLIKGGATIPAPDIIKQSPAPADKKSAWVWALLVICICIVIGGGIMFAMKK